MLRPAPSSVADVTLFMCAFPFFFRIPSTPRCSLSILHLLLSLRCAKRYGNNIIPFTSHLVSLAGRYLICLIMLGAFLRYS